MEEQMEEETRKRKIFEQKIQKIREGFPTEGSVKEARIEIKKFEDARQYLAAKQQVSAVSKLLDHIKEALDVKQALNNLEDVKNRITKLEALNTSQNELTNAINKLTIRIDNELVARRKMRDRESEILDKLGKYLDNWA